MFFVLLGALFCSVLESLAIVLRSCWVQVSRIQGFCIRNRKYGCLIWNLVVFVVYVWTFFVIEFMAFPVGKP